MENLTTTDWFTIRTALSVTINTMTERRRNEPEEIAIPKVIEQLEKTYDKVNGIMNELIPITK